MNRTLAENSLAIIKARIAEGDCPTTKPYPVEVLEELVVHFADRAGDAPDILAALEMVVADWPQFDTASESLRPGCQPEEDAAVNGADLVEWFGNWRRDVVIPAIAKMEAGS